MSADIKEQYDKIYRYCYFKVKNASLAEDITQETFLKYLSQNSYIERGRQMAYLYTIARNLCTDAHRQNKSAAFYENMEDWDIQNPLGEASLDQAELTLAVRQVLMALPADEQELLLLKYANQLSVGEIATYTGLSRFAVYRKTKYALSKLKKFMQREDFI